MSMTRSEKDLPQSLRSDSLKGNNSSALKHAPASDRRISTANRRNSDPALSSAIVGEITAQEVKSKTLTILIIEDSLSILKVVTQMLRQKGDEPWTPSFPPSLPPSLPPLLSFIEHIRNP